MATITLLQWRMDLTVKRSHVIKISCCEMDGNMSSCQPKVVHESCPHGEPSQSHPVRNESQRDKTNYVDGDMRLTGCTVWTRLTDTWTGENTTQWQLGEITKDEKLIHNVSSRQMSGCIDNQTRLGDRHTLRQWDHWQITSKMPSINTSKLYQKDRVGTSRLAIDWAAMWL